VNTYTLAPDGDDTPTLWRAESEHDQYPQPLAFMTAIGNTRTSLVYDDRGVVFRAAAAVLVADDELRRHLIAAIEDRRGSMVGGRIFAAPKWIVRAVVRLVLDDLRAHVEEAKP
jgi:hypothetical protein